MQILINQFSPDREINLTHLNELIEQAEKKVELKEYITTNSWDIMQNALEGAKIVQNNPINQKAVDDACGLLENGLKGLKADKSKLEQRLKDAKAYDGKEEFYTADSWKSFSDALAAAKSEYKSENSTPKTVKDAQEKLDAAIKGLTYMNVDKAQLQTLIETARGKAEEDYTTESWNVFAEALGNAEDELNSENSTPETVKDAQEKLDAAIKGLKAKKVDKSQLEALIKEAEGKKEADYTPESWTTFATELQKAKEVNSDKNAKQKTVDQTCESLRAAIDGLATKTVDKSQLETLIKEAEGKTETDYTAKSWAKLVTALEAARSEFRNENATQESVNNACDNLRTAIDGLTAKADKAQLKALIDEASNKNKTEYTSASWKALETALKNAQSVYDTEDATQKSVQEAHDSLKAAIDGLTAKADKTQLKALIDEANGKNKTEYTSASWKALEAALKNAQSVYDTEDATQKPVQDACDSLRTAIDGLKVKVDKTQLKALIDEANGKNKTEYTSASWKALETTLKNAQSVYDTEDATQKSVQDACDSLRTAIDGLKVKVDKSELQALITKAKDKKEADSWKVFADALANAENELKSDKSTPETVKAAQDKLSEAIKDLAPKKQVDKSKLEALIAEATGKVESQYTPESWTAFTTALGTANEVNGNKDATQETVDQACVNLRAGIDRLTAKADKTQLQALIDEASNKNKDEYTEESWASFETALNDAKGVSTNENASQDVVDKACESLSKAIEELKFNKSQLKVVIDQVENKNSEDYTEESWETFANALAEARSVFEDENATPESVDQAYRKLNEAINGLTVKVNKPELKELIDQVQDKKSEDYTDASWDAFETALEEAKAVFENEAATSEQISQAYRKLDEAIKGLAVKADKSELTTVIASSVTLNESDYTPESWKQFKEALDYADEVSANPNVSQEEVDEAKDKLEKAVKNLVKATGSEQKPTEKPDTKPDTKPDIKPEQKPTDKPVQKPTEKPSKNNGTNTGTSTHVGIFATTALASATAVLGLFGYKRRNKKK